MFSCFGQASGQECELNGSCVRCSRFLPLFFVCGVHLSLTMSTIARKRYDLPKKALIAVEADNIIVGFKSKRSDLFTWFFEGKQEYRKLDFCFHGNGKSVAGKVE